MRSLLVICGLLILITDIAAQPTEPCSLVSITAPAMVGTLDPIVFTARINKREVELTNVKYQWSVSAGKIIAGQGTSTITVDITGLAGTSVTARVEIDSLPVSCSRALATVPIIVETFSPPVKFDQYNELTFKDEKERLDKFASELLERPRRSSRGAIAISAGNPTYKGEAAYRLRRAKNYLVKVRGISAERLITIDAGYDTELITDLWIVPKGVPLPFYESKLPLSKVRFTKPKPTVNRKSTPRRRSY